MSSKHGSLDRTDFTVAFLSHVLLEANGDAAMEVGVVLGTNGGPVSYKELMGFRRGFLGCGCMLGGATVAGLFVPERYDRTNYFSPVPLDLLACSSALPATASSPKIVCSHRPGSLG